MILEDFRVKDLPETVFCIPNFVSESEEELLLKRIYEAPKVKWTNLLNRRLQNWGGLPKEKVRTNKDEKMYCLLIDFLNF